MKKKWSVGLSAGVPLMLVGMWSTRGLSPQDQLWEGVHKHDIALIESAMARGANATLPATPDNRFHYSPDYTPLQMFIEDSDNLEGVELMMQNADLKAPTDMYRRVPMDERYPLYGNPLHHLTLMSNQTRRRNYDLRSHFAVFLRQSAPINARALKPPGVTPLMLARQLWTFQTLLESGADPNLVADDGACLMNFVGQEPVDNKVWQLLKKFGGRPQRVPNTLGYPRPKFHRTHNSVEGWDNVPGKMTSSDKK
ncbi:hypothetical protein EON80_03275 [bacterium]|nr:MAG: hypothetical protein EON80_03275 [bacterium]